MSGKTKSAAAPAAASETIPAETVAPKAFEATVASIKENVARATAEIATTQAQVKQGMEKAMKTAEEFIAFGQGNAEAVMKAGQIWSTGVQDLSKQFAATAQASFEDAVATFKALSGVKSLKDAIDLQTSFARASFEKAMAESGKLTDASLKLTEQAMAPITARMTAAMETFAKAA
jgi:phasin family protein